MLAVDQQFQEDLMCVGVTPAYFEYVKTPSDGTKFFSNLVSANSFLTALA